jgi:hypothetical protein
MTAISTHIFEGFYLNLLEIAKKLLSAALVVLSSVIAYLIFCAARDFLQKGSTSISVYTLILLLVCLGLGAKLFHLLRS